MPRPWLVFLDPDTWIGSKAEHTRPDDITETWARLSPGEVLAVYQHATHRSGWIEDRVRSLSSIPADGRAVTGNAARDAAILWVRET